MGIRRSTVKNKKSKRQATAIVVKRDEVMRKSRQPSRRAPK